MKLIIDIPNEDYEFIKNLQSLIISSRGTTKTIQYNVINAIRNGIPYKEDTHKAYTDILEKQLDDVRSIGKVVPDQLQGWRYEE